MTRDRRRASWLGFEPVAARVAWTLSVIGAGLALLYVLRQVLLLLAFSVFFAYLLYPLVEAAQRRVPGLRSRTSAIAAVYLVLLGAVFMTGGVLGAPPDDRGARDGRAPSRALAGLGRRRDPRRRAR